MMFIVNIIAKMLFNRDFNKWSLFKKTYNIGRF